MFEKMDTNAEERSMFGYYVTAALIAVRMNIGLGYAFDRYVKPQIPKSGVVGFTPEESEAVFSMGRE